MFIPLFIANFISSLRGESQKRENLFMSFKDSSKSLSDVVKLQEAGLITAEQAQARTELIYVGARILECLPSLNPKTGRQFSHNESVNWLHSIIKRIALEAKKENVDDNDLSTFYNTKIDELQEKNRQTAQSSYRT